HIGGVDQVAAASHIVIQHRARSRLIGFLPEGHRRQRELGHEDAGLAKQALAHRHASNPTPAVSFARLSKLIATLSIGSRRGWSCSTTSHLVPASRHALRTSTQSRLPSPISASTGSPRSMAMSLRCTSGALPLKRRIQAAVERDVGRAGDKVCSPQLLAEPAHGLGSKARDFDRAISDLAQATEDAAEARWVLELGPDRVELDRDHGAATRPALRGSNG